MARGGKGREVSVGAVVSVSLILFAVGVLAVSKESRMFVPKVRYWARFDNTSGLANGSPVRLVGVQVGTVEGIEFPKDLKENKIKVVFSVDRSFAPRIRSGTMAYLKSLSYLSQDKYLELTPGDPDQPQLESGGGIEAGISAWESTLLQSQSIADDVKEITASLRDLLVALNRGEGLVQEMIHNPEFGRTGVADFEASLASLRRILEGLEQGHGVAGTLLTDRQFSRKALDNIDAALTDMRALLTRMDDPEGPVNQLIDRQGKGAAIVEDLRASAEALRRAVEKVSQGKGTVGRLVNDEEYATSLLKKVHSIASHADSIMGKIDRGEGTVGGLVNDPEIYESLKDVVAGIQKSRVGKGVVRHYGKKGAQSRPDQEEPKPEDEAPPPGPNP